jgi:putative PIG3 family NAD(P)H quinone oxidoreductase
MAAGARAVVINGSGSVDCLSIEAYEVPKPRAHEVLVEVAAAGLNRADVLQRLGHYPAPKGVPANVPGLEFAGVVVDVGGDVSRVRVGERVMGIVGGGAMATHLVTHELEVVTVPGNIDLIDAAGIPEAFMTAFDALHAQAVLAAEQWLLVHAVGSGIGTAAVQLGKHAGARVIGTSRSADKLERVRALGLDVAVHVSDGQFSNRVREVSDGGVHVILDTVGAAYLEENVRSLRPSGQMITIGLLGGAHGTLPLGLLVGKRLAIYGSVLRSRDHHERATLAADFNASVLPAFAEASLRPVIDDVVPMTEIRQAHSRMERNETFGKLVLRW